MIRLQNITKIYPTKAGADVKALRNVNLEFGERGLVFISGASGSGKTTLLNILGGLDQPTEGKIVIDGDKVLGKDLSLEQYRQNAIGFVFQEYNLLDDLNVFDNISLSVSYTSKAERKKAVDTVLKRVALSGYEKRRISELSGGQKQRIAIARALAKNSRILLCDEPTGNLDSETGKEIFDLLSVISEEKLVIVVSHNEEMASKYADRIIQICDGNIVIDHQIGNVMKTGDGRKRVGQVINRVSFGYQVKCGFCNLFTHKFKTFVSFLLLFLSVFTMCIMQICLSYNAERTIADSIDTKNTLIVLKNNIQSGGVSNESERYPLGDEITKAVGQEAYADGYKMNYGTTFLINEQNADLLENKDFYFKESLDDYSAYITDYFVDIAIRSDDFSDLLYTDYNDLKGREITYKGHVLFMVAGIIKTDYKTYFDERGNVKPVSDNYDTTLSYDKEINYKQNYEYRAIYMTDTAFEMMYSDQNRISYSADSGYAIKAVEGNYSIGLSHLQLIDIEGANPTFYTENGKYGVFNETNGQAEGTERRVLASDEIVISGDLYNRIFGESIDWEEFYFAYDRGILSGEPLQNALPHLNKRISVSVEIGTEKKEVQNKKVVGVEIYDSFGGEESIYTVYGTKSAIGLDNKMLHKHYVTELNKDKLSGVYTVLKELRADSVLVAGTTASLIYEKEYIIRQMSYFLIGVAAVISVIAVISIFNLVNTKIRDKKKEIGILAAIGLKKSEINFIYLFSILCMTILAIAFTIGGLYLTTYMVNAILFQNPFGYIAYFSVSGLTYLVLAATGLLLFWVSLYPLMRMTRRKPVDMIRQ